MEYVIVSSTTSQSVFILMETGFIMRNLLLGTFATDLADRVPVTVAVLNPDDPNLRQVVTHPNIELTQYLQLGLPKPTGVREMFHFPSVMYRVKQVEKASASLELQTKLFDGGTESSVAKRLVRSALLNIGRGIKMLHMNAWLDERYLDHIRTWEVTQQWRAIFLEKRPQVVVSTMLTHAIKHQPTSDLPAVIAAHDLCIPVGTLVQSWDNLSSKACILPIWLDAVWTWSAFMSAELEEFHPRVPQNRVSVVGSPQFDFHLDPQILESRDHFMSGLGLDPQRPMIVIGTGTAVWLPQEPEIVSQLVGLLHHHLPDVQILVRLHPKDHGDHWKPYTENLNASGVVLQKTSPETHMDSGGFIPPLDFYREQVNTLHHAAVVLNTASTLTVDAAIVDCPVISMGYDIIADSYFPEGRAWSYNHSVHFNNLVKTGGVWVVRSQEECLDAIRSYLADRSLHQQERRQIVATAAGTIDGQAGSRLANAVWQLAQTNTPSPKA